MTFLSATSRKWFEERIEAFLDGTLPAEEAERFRDEGLLDEELSAEVNLSKQIQRSLRATVIEPCPPHVARNIMAHVRQDIRSSWWSRIQAFLLGLSPSQLRPVMALALLLVIAISTLQLVKVDPAPQAEVHQALDEVKWTLAYLSDVGKSTGSTVKTSVIENQIVNPMSRSFSTILEN